MTFAKKSIEVSNVKDIVKWKFQKTAQNMIEKLQGNGFEAFYAEDLLDAKSQVLKLLPKGVTIGLGGSMTIEDMDILTDLRSDKYKLIDRYQPQDSAQHISLFREALRADYFFTGANAITKDGEIICTDCSGNRVAAMMFGPEKVIIVVGVNKLVDSIEQALTRIKNIAPMNAKRNHHPTPCAVSGVCENCHVPERMCNYTGIIHTGLRFEGRIMVIVIADSVGL